MDKIVYADETMDGQRLDTALSQYDPGISRNSFQKMIREGDILVNGKSVKPNYRLCTGDEIVIREVVIKEPDICPENIPLDILYEDKDVLVVNKPKGMVVHPAPGHSTGTLVNALMYHCKDSLSGINGELRPGIVHRIDKDTTGSLIVCKNDLAHGEIARQIQEHSFTRIYYGIVIGRPPHEEGTVDDPIGRSLKDRKKMAVNRVHGKPAVTHYRVLRSFRQYSFVEFRLETGRTHQIRVHMASIGHPLLGDAVYGPARCPYHLQGQTLHAALLGFTHPTTGVYIEVQAPLPEYFEQLLKELQET